MKKNSKKSENQVDMKKVSINKPKSPKILPDSIEWMKKGKDANCSY